MGGEGGKYCCLGRGTLSEGGAGGVDLTGRPLALPQPQAVPSAPPPPPPPPGAGATRTTAGAGGTGTTTGTRSAAGTARPTSAVAATAAHRATTIEDAPGAAPGLVWGWQRGVSWGDASQVQVPLHLCTRLLCAEGAGSGVAVLAAAPLLATAAALFSPASCTARRPPPPPPFDCNWTALVSAGAAHAWRRERPSQCCTCIVARNDSRSAVCHCKVRALCLIAQTARYLSLLLPVPQVSVLAAT